MTKKTKTFAYAVVFLSFALTIVMADLFSSLITVGNFAFLQTQGIKASAYKIYALSVEESTSEQTAEDDSKNIKLRGGAGYIYLSDGINYVLASAYENENDAIKVQDNLEENQTRSKIITLNVDAIEVDITLSGNEKTSLQNAINVFKETYKILYDISISLDTSVSSLPEAKLLVTNQFEDVASIKSSFDTLFLGKLTSEILAIKLKLNELTNTIEALATSNLNEKILYSSSIKACYIKSIILNKELAKELVS